MFTRQVIFYWCLILLVSGCASTSDSYYRQERSYYEPRSPAVSNAPNSSSEIDAGAGPVSTRKTHYKGYMKVSVKNVQDSIKQATQIVDVVGGYVEQQSGQDLVFRVPVQHFVATYQQLLELGVVLDKSMMARDITFTYQDSQARLKIAKATLARLQILLQQTKKEEDRLLLLKEIQRVSEQVQVLTGQLQALDGLAKYSQLSMTLVPRVKASQQKNNFQAFEGFGWIDQLSAFNQRVAQSNKRVSFATPEGMVLLDSQAHQGVWIAESADHSVVWASRLENNPKADSAFWAEAIRKRIGNQFSNVKEQALSEQSDGFRMIRLMDHASEPYVYWIAVRADKDRLYLVEAYFPTQALEAKYGPGIKNSLLKGEK